MSLTWSIENVKDWKTKKKKQINCTKLDAIIWGSMTVGINKITEKNYHQFYLRMSAMERVFGTMHYKNKKPMYTTLEDVKMWIGLRTNVNKVSASDFEKHLIKYLKIISL